MVLAAGNNQRGSIGTINGSFQTIDTGVWAVSTITNDQVQVTATVPASFTFSLSTNAQALGTLSMSSVIAGSGVQATIVTNAANGWYGWVKSTNAALTSVVTGGSIGTAGTLDNTPTQLSTGSEGYVLDADLATDDTDPESGTVALAGEYNGTLANSGGTLSTLWQPFASSTGPTSTDRITLVPRVSISPLTPAATDYSDTLTIVAAGRF